MPFTRNRKSNHLRTEFSITLHRPISLGSGDAASPGLRRYPKIQPPPCVPGQHPFRFAGRKLHGATPYLTLRHLVHTHVARPECKPRAVGRTKIRPNRLRTAATPVSRDGAETYAGTLRATRGQAQGIRRPGRNGPGAAVSLGPKRLGHSRWPQR